MQLEVTKYCWAFTTRYSNDNTKCYPEQCTGMSSTKTEQNFNPGLTLISLSGTGPRQETSLMKRVYTFTHFGRLQKAFYHNSVNKNFEVEICLQQCFLWRHTIGHTSCFLRREMWQVFDIHHKRKMPLDGEFCYICWKYYPHTTSGNWPTFLLFDQTPPFSHTSPMGFANIHWQGYNDKY